ncbi:helix-turn-helix domain-containing protein [Halalkalibacter sp. AB-rgal2]|uniref:helix-turn-helix domain-containing protein n=1 Tax=Halalkalibacter sp. AB-rgal2 TaxID=3242695 RepID=UPI00359EC90E
MYNAVTDTLRKVGLSNKPICLHSSLRSFGWVEGRAETIIKGFLDLGCTMLVPEFSYDFSNRKKEMDDQAVKIIIELLEENYGDPDLCLYRISEEVGLPEKFVSQLFKQKLGQYLSDYIETLRMNKASELLSTTNKTIEEISIEVGYKFVPFF